MGATIARTPWMGSFSLTDTAIHKLSDLLRTATNPPVISTNSARCQFLNILNDIDNGGAKLYIGNENLSLTFFGYKLVASQSVPLYSMDSNLINLDQIYVLADTNPTIVCVNLLTR